MVDAEQKAIGILTGDIQLERLTKIGKRLGGNNNV